MSYSLSYTLVCHWMLSHIWYWHDMVPLVHRDWDLTHHPKQLWLMADSTWVWFCQSFLLVINGSFSVPLLPSTCCLVLYKYNWIESNWIKIERSLKIYIKLLWIDLWCNISGPIERQCPNPSDLKSLWMVWWVWKSWKSYDTACAVTRSQLSWTFMKDLIPGVNSTINHIIKTPVCL